jgi:hypothetical protein
MAMKNGDRKIQNLPAAKVRWVIRFANAQNLQPNARLASPIKKILVWTNRLRT